MTPSPGSLRLFQVAGINVYLHWSWFAVALLELTFFTGRYRSPVWNAVEYLSLFAIVLLHEFGHALACRQVGGVANQIVLWPMGGVAYVNPPQRPGATLWSIVAGPLVNVVLFGLSSALFMAGSTGMWWAAKSDLSTWILALIYINFGLLVFNLLPIYPLDGGQIFRSLMWFVLGRAKSLLIATLVGMVGVILLLGLAAWSRSVWIGVIALYMFGTCWRSFQVARMLLMLDKLPQRAGWTCPSCRTPPPVGPWWACQQCQTLFDTFEPRAVCPQCANELPEMQCLHCGVKSPLNSWDTR